MAVSASTRRLPAADPDAIDRDLAFLRDLIPQLMDWLVARRAARNAIDRDPNLSGAGKLAALTAWRQAALAEIDDLAADARAARERLGERTAAALQDAPRDVAGELRYARTWHAIERVLDAAADAAVLADHLRRLIDDAARDGDGETLAVLDSELRLYLRARGYEALVEGIAPQLLKARLPLLTPTQRAAILARQEVAAGWPRLEAAFRQCRHEIEGGSTTVVLPGWRENEQVTP